MSGTLHHLAERFVPEGRRYDASVDLRDLITNGDDLSQPLLYGSDIWAMSEHRLAPTGARGVVRFDKFPERWRRMLKDYALLVTNPHLALEWSDSPAAHSHAVRKPAAWTTVIARLKGVASTLTMMEERQHITVDEADWHLVLADMQEIGGTYHNRAHSLTAESMARIAGTLRLLHDLGPVHGHERPWGTRPWGTREINAAVGFAAPAFGERRNKHEPHANVGALLGVCIYMLDHLTEPVLARLRWWHSRPEVHHGGVMDKPVRQRLLDAYVAAAGAGPLRATEFAGSRGDKGDPNVKAIADFHGLGDLYFGLRELEAVPWEPAADPFPDALPTAPTADGIELQWTDALMPGDGLEWWADRLVFAALYVLHATTGLRNRAVNGLAPGCVEWRDYGGVERAVMSGHLMKNTKYDEPPPVEWFVNDYVVAAVELLEQLRDIYEVPDVLHPRTEKPRLVTYDLLKGAVTGKSGNPIRFTAESIGNWLLPATEQLAERGLVAPVEDLQPPNPTTIRNTAMDAFARERFGDAVAAAMGHWSNMSTALGYIGRASSVLLGRRPNVLALADPVEARERAQQQDAEDLFRLAAEEPETLTGRGADRLIADASQRLATTPVSDKALARAAKKTKSLTWGWLSGCLGGPGGLCSDDDEVNHRLCMLGCREQVLTPYHRAKLEYARRTRERLGALPVRYGAKLEGLSPDIIEEFSGLSDEEVIDVLTDGWPDVIRKAVFDAEAGEH